MSTAIKPKQGIVYECYKGFTDFNGDRCRVGQKFVYDSDFGPHSYLMEKASGRGIGVFVSKDKFAAHFIPAEQQEETYSKSKYKVGDKVEIVDNITNHRFAIGEIVTVHSIDRKGEVNTCKGKTTEGNEEFYFIDEETEIIPYTEKTETKSKFKSKSKFKVGDKVLISDDSMWYDQGNANPANVEGEVTEIQNCDLGIVVKWSNDTSNSYNDHDLLLITGEAKSKSYIDGVEDKGSKKLKVKDMNINLSAIAITDLDQIKAIAELIPSIKEQLMKVHPELFEPEVTHKVGNRYEHSDGNTYLLVGENGYAALANLNTGMIESYTVKVSDYDKITADEFKSLCMDSDELELIEY